MWIVSASVTYYQRRQLRSVSSGAFGTSMKDIDSNIAT
jgi:hypothetical protein